MFITDVSQAVLAKTNEYILRSRDGNIVTSTWENFGYAKGMHVVFIKIRDNE